MPTVDSLDIQISASAANAERSLERLASRLGELSRTLGKLNTNSVANFSNSMKTLSDGMRNFSTIKVSDFSRTAKGIQKFGEIDSAKISSVGTALKPLADGVNILSNSNFNNKGINNLINSLTRLSNSNAQNLSNVDFKGIGNSLNELSSSLANAPKVQHSVISMTNSIAKLAQSGSNIPVVSSSLGMLGTSLESFMVTMSNAPKVSAETINLSNSIATLASAGAKTQTTAASLNALGVGLKGLMQTLSTAPQVSPSIIQMTNALANLASQGRNVRSATSGISTSLTQTSRAAKNTTKSTLNLAAAFGKFYANYFLVVRGIKKLWSSIEGTADYIEAFNYFNVAMGKIGSDWSSQYEKYGYENAESYAESFKNRLSDSLKNLSGVSINIDSSGMGILEETGMKNLGLNIQEITQYASQLASVTNSVGQTGEVSLATASAFTKLGADISSLFNMDYSSVMGNLQSGLIGQSRALYKYGIDITNATLQTYAYELGLSKAVSEMTQAEKMQLRMIAILEQSKVSWGDLANTINSPSNMIRQFKNNLKETGMVLGQLFMPLLENLLPALNGLTIAFKRLFTSIASVFGIKINLEEFGEGYTETEDTLGDIADSYDEATSAAKKYQNQILGFDEVTKLQDTSSTDSGSSGGAGGTIDLTDEILKATEEYEKAWEEAYDRMENKANSIADRISKAFSDGWKDSDFSSIGGYVGESFNKSLEGMNWSSIKKTGKKISTSFATLLNGFFATPNLFSNIGTSIAEGLNTAVMMSSTFAGTLDWSEMGNSIASGINDFFDTFDFPSLAEKTNKWVQGVSEAFITAITNIDWLNIYDKFTEYLANIDIKTASIIISSVIVKKILSLNIASAVISAIGLSISQKIAGAIASTLGLSIASNAGIGNALLTAGASIGSTFITGFKAFLGSSSASAALAFINPVTLAIAGIGSIIAGVGVAFLNFFSMLDGGFNWVKEALMLVGIAIAAVGAVILGAPAFVAGVVAGIVGIVATMVVVIKENWDSIANFASKTWGNISKLFSTVANWFNINVIIPVKSFFLNLCSKIGTFFSNLWSGISSIWSTVANWFSLNVIEPIVGFFSAFSARVKVIFEGLWILVRAVWILASSWFSNYVTTPISNAFSFLSSNVTRFFSNLWSGIQNIWRNVSSWFSNNVITPVRNLFSNVTSFISNVFNNAKTMVVNIWSNFSTWISNNVTTPVVNIFNNACDRIGGFFSSLWSGIKSGLASAMNVVIYGIESGINFIVSGLNGIIGGFNKIVTVAAKIVGADWSGVKKLSKVDLGRISVSAYATGGFPEDGLFYANHTELVGQFSNGKTAVANNEQITQGIANAVYPAVYNAVSQAMRSNSSGSADVVVNIDGKEVFHAVQTQATNYTRRTGKLAFPV